MVKIRILKYLETGTCRITKIIGIYRENVNLHGKHFNFHFSWGTCKYEQTSGFFEPGDAAKRGGNRLEVAH